MSSFFLWGDHGYIPFKYLPPTPAKELRWVIFPVRIQHTLCQYVIPLTFPLPSLLQVLPNAEPLSVKLCAYPFDTRASSAPWFLTQVEVSTLHLCNVSLTSFLTPVHVFLAHLPPIILIYGGVWNLRHGVIHASVQLHCRSCPHEVIVMRVQDLYLLHPVVSPMPLTPPYRSQMMINLQYDAAIILVYGEVWTHI